MSLGSDIVLHNSSVGWRSATARADLRPTLRSLTLSTLSFGNLQLLFPEGLDCRGRHAGVVLHFVQLDFVGEQKAWLGGSEPILEKADEDEGGEEGEGDVGRYGGEAEAGVDIDGEKD